MWHDIFIANKPALLNALDEFVNHLQVFRQIIDQEDSEKCLIGSPLLVMLAVILGICSPKTDAQNLILLLPRCHQGYYYESKLSYSATNAISGVISVPGDKSISHRSIMFGALLMVSPCDRIFTG